MKISQILVMVFAPLIFSILLCTIYSLLIIIYITKKLHKHIFETIKLNNNTNNKYEEIDKNFKKYFFNIHRAGTICYLLSSLLIIIFYLLTFSNDWKNNLPIILSIIAVGLLSGLFWNILGYYSDQTINWRKIYLKIGPAPAKLKSIKFKYYMKYRILNTLLLLLYILLTLIALLKIPQNIQILKISGGLESLYLLLTIFITIITVYMKQIYQLYYDEKNSNTTFFKLNSFIYESKMKCINKKQG